MRFRRLLSRLPNIDIPLSTGERLERMIKTQEQILSEQARIEGMMSHYENRLDKISSDVRDIKKIQDRPRPPEGLMEAVNRPPENNPSLFPKNIVEQSRSARKKIRYGQIVESDESSLQDSLLIKSIEVFAQPIVTLPQRQVFAYEMFARIKSPKGTYVSAARYCKSAEEKNLIAEFDQTVLVNILEHIARMDTDKDSVFFLNLAPSTLKSAPYLNMLLDFLKTHRAFVNRIIFEMSQKEYDGLNEKQSSLLKALRRAGYRLSMDHIEKPQLDYKTLKSYDIEFLKFHAFYLMPVLRTSTGHERLRHMMKGLKMSGFKTIVDRVEQEREVCEMLEFEIPYGQGFLFGMPEKASYYNLIEEKAA